MATLNMTRQMQYVILGVMLACGALFAVINFIMVPLITEWKTNLAKTREIQTMLSDVRTVIRTRQDVQEEIEATQDHIRKMVVDIPWPVLGNYLLGMDENIRAGIMDLDVQISQVVNQGILELAGSEFNAYRVRVTARAGFHALIRLFRNLEAGNSLCSVSGLTILPCANTPEKHDVTFAVLWLIWKDPTNCPLYLIQSEIKDHQPES